MATKARTVAPNILGPQYVICFMSPFRPLKFRGGFLMFKNLCTFNLRDPPIFEAIMTSRCTDIEKASLCVTTQCNVPSCDHVCTLFCFPAVSLAVFPHP